MSLDVPGLELNWMDHLPVYLACAVGALGLFLLVRHQDVNYRILGMIAGIAGVGWLFMQLTFSLAAESGEGRPAVLFWVFAAIAIGAAVRMVTHTRPVYSALYFVMVVLSSSALFLLLGAEFMAFALVIVYAGAILITYLFVLMLAQQAPTESEETKRAGYDRFAREPAAASVVGFILIAVLGQAIFDRDRGLPSAPTSAERFAMIVNDLNLQPEKIRRFIEGLHERQIATDLPATATLAALSADQAVFFTDGSRGPRMTVDLTAGDVDAALVEAFLPRNIETVGLALVWKFPASLEVAGIILLMAMFGAVVLARKQIELGEDEKRQHAGMRRFSVESTDAEPGQPGSEARP